MRMGKNKMNKKMSKIEKEESARVGIREKMKG